MIGLYWKINIMIVLVELVLAVLLLRNYYGIRKLKVGLKLFGIALIFLLQSILAIAFYIRWAEMGLGKEVAVPLILLSLGGLIGVSLLYSVSRM